MRSRTGISSILRAAALALALLAPAGAALAQTIADTTPWATATTPLRSLDVSGVQDSRAQTRMWRYANSTWAVLADSSGVFLYRLDRASSSSRAWVRTAVKLSDDPNARPSVAAARDSAPLARVPILVLSGTHAFVHHLRYNAGTAQYELQPADPADPNYAVSSTVPVGPEASVATLARDSTGRLWLVSNTSNAIVARHASPPYATWSEPIEIASGVRNTDIAGVVALSNSSIGVFWSNRNTNRFGFRARLDAHPPTTWGPIETPDQGPNPNMGVGPADSQFNLAVWGSTVYAAVKLDHTNPTQPLIGLLVRDSRGAWSPLIPVDTIGARPAVSVDRVNRVLRVVYASAPSGGDLLMAEASVDNPVFAPRRVLATGSENQPSAWNNATVENSWTSQGLVMAFEGPRALGILTHSSTRGAEVVVPHVPGETPQQTTTRLQGLIDQASSTGAGLRLQANKVFDLATPLVVRFPGPRYIDGGLSTLRRVAAAGPAPSPGSRIAVLDVESAQDGLVIRDLNILASDGAYALPKEPGCTITWAHDGAPFGIRVANTRWATLRRVTVWHAATAGIAVYPSFGTNEGTLIESSAVRYSKNALWVWGAGNNRVRSTRIVASTFFFSRETAAYIGFVDDLQILGGAIEKAMVDLLNIRNSNRVQSLTYLENYGGYVMQDSGAQLWCPRDPAGNLVDMLFSTDVLVRGRGEDESIRSSTIGPVVAQQGSTRCRVVRRDADIGGSCSGPAVTAPNLARRFEQAVPGAHGGEPVDILPSDDMATVRTKIAQAAAAAVGVRLQPGGVYTWEPISLRFLSNHPAYIDGRGATINLSPGVSDAPAMLRFFQPYSAFYIGRDRFAVHNLTLNTGGRAQYGVLLEVSQGTTLRGITVNDATRAGFRAEASSVKNGGGVYYGLFADNTVRGSPAGIQLVSPSGYTFGAWVNANVIENFRAENVATVYDFYWTAATQVSRSTHTYTPGYAGNRLLFKGERTQEVEFHRTLFDGRPPTAADLVTIGWSPGLYYDLTQ